MTLVEASWDLEAALQSVDGDRELLVEMAELFLQDSGHLLEEIGQAIQAGSASGLHRSAHTLKGSVANFVADQARDAALQLETMGRAGNLAEAPQQYALLVAEIHRVEADLSEFVQAAV
jgi:HPt (histidine-containing phosphotransfer) domain-containing protein